MTGLRDDITGALSLLCVPPPPDLPVYGGGRGLGGPRRMLRPGRHLYEGGLGTWGPSPPHSHTHTSHMQVLGTIHGGGSTVISPNFGIGV